MNPPDNSDLEPLKRADGDPVFDEPWQAQALALADTLIETGVLSAGRWSETLGEELDAAQVPGSADDIGTYYSAVLAALERLLHQQGGVTSNEMLARRDAWEQAYLETPHGQPVELKE